MMGEGNVRHAREDGEKRKGGSVSKDFGARAVKGEMLPMGNMTSL